MTTDLIVGVLLLVVGWPLIALLLALLFAQCVRAGQGPGPEQLPAAELEPDLLADQPVEVLSPAEVERRFAAVTRGGPRREWWA